MMTCMPATRALTLALLCCLAGCAVRPVNPPLTQVDQNNPYLLDRLTENTDQNRTLVILSFSGGGTRAAAFSYGVLETLHRTEIEQKDGKKVRMLDWVDTITGVSGGSFTALAYRLYGDKLFGDYEKRFLKRNIQGELIGRVLNPLNWPALSSTGWGRSELAADLYDEVLFKGATFADLKKTKGPFVAVSATDITTGTRVDFIPTHFEALCTDLDSFRIARAAAASSAVPVVLSPVTINNYGGSCGFKNPYWTTLFLDGGANPPRPAARVTRRLQELIELTDGDHPFLHLVDGGVSDNLGLRGVLDTINLYEAMHEVGLKSSIDHASRIIVFVVNSVSIPDNNWSKSERAPGMISMMIKAAGVPINRYSGEQIEQLKDIEARWKTLRRIRDSNALTSTDDAEINSARRVPNAELYAINVSFAALNDDTERNYLNQLPTSFVLQDEAVDRLRAAAAKIIIDSPDFQRLLKDMGATTVQSPARSTSTSTSTSTPAP